MKQKNGILDSAEEDNVQEIILEIITKWRSYFDGLHNPEYSIPTDNE
jgi:hypothetical protein